MAKSLLLHEESDCRELIKRVLLENGHEVVAFDKEEEALGWTRSNPVDLAIVSLGSSVSQNDAWQQLKHLNKNVKILVLARLVAKDWAKKAVEEGADDYLLKPVDIEVLESKIKSLQAD